MPKVRVMPETDIIVLGQGHAHIAGHVPDAIPLHSICEKQVEDASDNTSLGLFDSSSPNYTTYYPDVTAEDLKPTDADFIFPVFRLLSNVIVHKQHNPIEFSESSLKSAMSLLVGQTINVDHETALGNAIGVIQEVSWGKAYKTKEGITVPAGINGKFKIDGKSNPRIARGILMEPPSIHSNSVTVRFKWKQSHEFEGKYEFWDRLGDVHQDGTIIRRIVTEIIGFSETSLVNHGADPFAKLLNENNEIVNPSMANSFYSFKMEDGKEVNTSKFAMIDYKDQTIGQVSNSRQDGTSPNPTTLDELNNKNNTNKNNDKMKKQLLQLCLIMGITDETKLTEENFVEEVKNHMANLKSDGTALKDVQEELTTSKEALRVSEEEVTGLKTKVSGLEANATIGSEATEAIRNEALSLYNLSKGDKADKDMQELISKSDYKTALTFKNQFETSAEEKFEMTCNSCQSTDVSRASAQNTDGDGNDDNVERTDEQVSNSLRDSKRKKDGFFHREGKA